MIYAIFGTTARATSKTGLYNAQVVITVPNGLKDMSYEYLKANPEELLKRLFYSVKLNRKPKRKELPKTLELIEIDKMTYLGKSNDY